jgi:hypothetical protein
VLAASLAQPTRVMAAGPPPAPPRPFDWNQDGVLTVADFVGFPNCLTGPVATALPECGVFDADRNNRVDTADYRAVQRGLSLPPIAGDWNADGTVYLDDFAAMDACLGGPGMLSAVGCQVFDFDADGDVDLFDVGAMLSPIVECGVEPPHHEPANWLDTAANNSMAPDPALFRLFCVDGQPAFGTQATAVNIHSHWVGPDAADRDAYVYTGRMMLTDLNGGVGVTFFSDYPQSDRYYRLRRLANRPSFHIAPHLDPDHELIGDTETNVQPTANVWYQFRIEIRNGVDCTALRAKVWPAGGAVPSEWQIDCYDPDPARLTRGTHGVWSLGNGRRYWQDLTVRDISCVQDSDLDGTADCADACPQDPAKVHPGLCGCGTSDADPDGDGVPACLDQCPQTADTDTDGDGSADCIDGCPFDPAKTEPLVCGCGQPETDSDSDGEPDCVEPPALCLTAAELHFGSAVDQLGLEVWSCGGIPLAYAWVENQSWLSVAASPGAGVAGRDLLTFTVDRKLLAADGRTFAQIWLEAPAGGISIPIDVTVDRNALVPAARWNVVPRQRINTGETLTCGVVAFSKVGIDHIRFQIYGPGYTGPNPVTVTQMTYNPRTQVWEYVLPVQANDFSADGLATVYATAVGTDGGQRHARTRPGHGLEPLKLWVNPLGTLPARVAWVDLAGDDATGVVDDPAQPFQRVSVAMQALAAAQGGSADGGEVRIRPGHHEADGGGIFGGETAVTVDEWITLTHDPAAGGAVGNTIIDRRGTGDWTSRWLRVRGLTLTAPEIINGGGASDGDRYDRSVWLQDCDIIGSIADRPFPVGSGWRGPHYYTECTIRDQRRASGNGQNHRLMRNLTITNTREDVFQAVPFGVNIWVDGVDPGAGPNPEHADVIQSPGAVKGSAVGMHNWIFYNVVATDLHYQALFGRTGAIALDNAFVNCLFEMRSPVRVGGVGTALGGMYDHLLFWHCSFIGTGTPHKTVLGRSEFETLPPDQWLMANLSVRGCLFERYQSAVGSVWFANLDVAFLDNHYIVPGGSAGVFSPDSGGGTITTGDPRIVTNVAAPDFGAPADPQSPLLGRVTPHLIPADARGNAHDPAATVGALRD